MKGEYIKVSIPDWEDLLPGKPIWMDQLLLVLINSLNLNEQGLKGRSVLNPPFFMMLHNEQTDQK